MTRTSKRWIVRLLSGLVGIAAFGEPAMAEGWLRSRLRGLCETPAAPMPQPAAPLTTPIEPPPAVAPKVDAKDVVPMPAPEPRFEPIVSAALGDSSQAVSFSPAMFGDLNGRGTISSLFPISITAAPLPTPTPGVPGRPTPPPAPRIVILQFPRLSYASFKISENESPRPTDRVFVTYNYYNGLPTSPYTPSFDVHRETVGFEKTFLDGSASIGVRVPFLQLSGPDNVFNAFNVRDGQFGDVSVITKYAFYDDRTTGNLMSGGLMVTAPTGQTAYTVNGQRIHSTLWQPWGGYIWSLSDDFFVQGFSSIVIPSDSQDVTAWYNDFALGYWLRKGQYDRFFHGIVPTAEVHVGTPLTNRGDADINQVHVPDYVSLVGGVNFVFWRNSTFGIAAGAPVTGAKPWDFETHVSLNIRF